MARYTPTKPGLKRRVSELARALEQQKELEGGIIGSADLERHTQVARNAEQRQRYLSQGRDPITGEPLKKPKKY